MTITLPVVLPSIAAGAIIVFMSSLADFGTPMLIGEGFKVLPVLVYEEYMSEMGGDAILIIIVMDMLISYIIVRLKGKIGLIIDLLIMFPYVIPGAVLGIGLLIAFNKPPLLLTGTPFIIVAAYVVRKLPYTVRSGSAFLQQIDPSIEEASISLGVSPRRTFFNMTARMMLPGICSGAILSWITCINELSSSIMLYTGKTSTIPVAIYTEVVRNSFGTGAALASILTFTTVISILLFMKLTKGKGSVI